MVVSHTVAASVSSVIRRVAETGRTVAVRGQGSHGAAVCQVYRGGNMYDTDDGPYGVPVYGIVRFVQPAPGTSQEIDAFG